MNSEKKIILERDAVMQPYTADIAAYCTPFSCEDDDLDDFSRKMHFFTKPNYWEKLMRGLTFQTRLKY